MLPLLLAHILAGGLGLVSGFLALHAAKGAPLHRKAGVFFVAVMLTMATTGMVLAVLHGAWAVINLAAAIVTAYLVVTALLTVRASTVAARRVEFATMLVWVWRVRVRKALRGLVVAGAAESA